MNEPPLRGLRVIVTRPAAQADGLCRQLEQAGAEAARLPLFTTEPVADIETLAERLRDQLTAQLWIFTSRNAVEPAAAALPDVEWPTLLAVGEASAQALREAGHGPVITPAETSSEGLLALPELEPERVVGRSLLILAGEGGRDVLETELRARGANVHKLALYRRTPVSYQEDRVRSELLVADILLLSSAEAMQRLLELCDDRDRQKLFALPTIVSSARLKQLATQHGFCTVEVAASALDLDQLRAVERMARAWRPDRHRDDHAQASTESRVSDVRSAGPDNDAEAGSSEPPSPAAAATTPAPASTQGRRPALAQWSLTGVLLVALLAAAAWIWYAERSARQQRSAQALALAELTREFGDSRSQVSDLGDGLSSMSRELQRAAQERRVLADRVQDQAQLMSRVGAELRGGYRRLMLEACEQLLVEASDALLLRKDVRTAIIALELADRRLSLLRDPRLLPLRQQIHDDLLSLQAVKMPDTVEVSLRLSSLADATLNMPLAGQRTPRSTSVDVAAAAANPPAEPPPEAPEASGMASVGTWLRELFARLVTVERVDDPMRYRQLPEAERFAVRQVLMLRLEATRLALLQRNSAVLSSAATEAHRWLAREFDPSDPAVELALRDLELIAALDFAPALPALDTSLNLLQEQLDPGPAP